MLFRSEIPHFSDTTSTNQVVISKPIADKLKLKLGDRILAYFIQDNVRVRPLTIKGIYQTNFTEYDNLFLLTDLYTVNRLNNWESGQVSGAEIQLYNYDLLEDFTYDLAEVLDNQDPYDYVHFF